MTSTPQTPDAAALGLPAPQGSDLIRDGDNAITTLGNLLAARIMPYTQRAIATSYGDNLDNIQGGIYTVWSEAAASNLGLPSPGRGTLIVSSYGTAGSEQLWLCGMANPEIWQRARLSGGWAAWQRMDARHITPMWRGATGLGSSTNLDTLTTGIYTIWSGAAAEAMGLPRVAGGVLEVFTYGVAGGVQVYRPLTGTSSPQVWQRHRVSGGWRPWERIDATSVTTSPATPTAGFRTVPLALSTGHSGADTNTTGHARVPVHYNAPITRWRVHIRNVNPRYNISRTGAVDFTGLWLGDQHATSPWGMTATPTQVHGPFSLPADGSEWVSPWFTNPIGDNIPRLLSYGYTASAGTTVHGMLGTCWRSTTPGHASGRIPVGSAALSGLVPFWVWLEAETPAKTPAVAVVADSRGLGHSATWPLYDSPLSIHCRRVGALPIHYGASGDSMGSSLDPDHLKWRPYPGTTPPDSVLWSMGGNDMAAPNLAELQTRHATIASIIRDKLSPTIYASTVPCRTTETNTSPWETLRRSYNTWLRTQPNGIRDLFEFAAAISTDDDTITPAYDSGDGIHLTTAGYTALANAITRPITA